MNAPNKFHEGLQVTQGNGMTRIRIGCEHQQGLIYLVPAEKTWVCSPELLPSHALSGFLTELTAQQDERVGGLMQSWGIYFRELPLEGTDVG